MWCTPRVRPSNIDGHYQGRPERPDAASQVRRPEFPAGLLRRSPTKWWHAAMPVSRISGVCRTVPKRSMNSLRKSLRRMFLPRVSAGETCAMDLTEPDAGSDLGAVMLKATYDEKSGRWLLNGVKRFITNGDGHISLVLARTEEGTSDARGLSMLVLRQARRRRQGAPYREQTRYQGLADVRAGLHQRPRRSWSATARWALSNT